MSRSQWLERPWRVGRHLGRTLYVQVGDEPSGEDTFMGVMDTKELALHVVMLHNQNLERTSGGNQG